MKIASSISWEPKQTRERGKLPRNREDSWRKTTDISTLRYQRKQAKTLSKSFRVAFRSSARTWPTTSILKKQEP